MPTLEDQDSKLLREDGIAAHQAEMFNSHPDILEMEKRAGNQSDNGGDIRQQEDTPNDFGYSKKTSDASTPAGEKGQSKLTGRLKKFGPTGGIVGILIGGVFGIGVMFSPSIAILHLKEVITGGLNDQAGAMQVRTNSVLRAKFKDTFGKDFSACNAMVKFRCSLRTMSNRQIKNFEKAGIEVEKGSASALPGRTAITGLTFTDSSGNKIRIDSIDQFNQLNTRDSAIKSQLRRAYNPIFYSAWDPTAGKALKKLGLNRASKIKGTSQKAIDESFNKSLNESQTSLEADTRPIGENDSQQDIADKEEYNKSAKQLTESIKSSGGFGSVFGSVAKGSGVLGALSTVCEIRSMSLKVEAGAKIIRSTQLASFAMTAVLTIADEIKASAKTATPEVVSNVGTRLMSTDTQQMVIDETSPAPDGVPKKVPNPYYGKNAFDSEGYRAVAYNDAPKLTARAQQFMLGGAMTGRLASVNDAVLKILGKNPDAAKKTCGFVNNKFISAGSMIIGGLAAAATFGAFTALQLSASLGFALAQPLLIGYLKDMIAGKVVDSGTKGVDAGNAIVGGSAKILGDMAQTRGLQPANASQLQQYLAAIKPYQDQMIAEETEAAKSTPFDVMNQYSFLGSLSRKMLPVTMSANTTAGSLPSLVSSLGSLVTESVLPSVKADTAFNPERYSRCNDQGYANIGIDADVMCNVRFALTPTELSMDTDGVYEWMSVNKYVNDSGVPDDPDGPYSRWLNECVDRAAWGIEDDEGNDGRNCLDQHAGNRYSLTELQHFRVFTIDRSIEQGMDDGPETGQGVPSGTSTGTMDGSISELAKTILDNSGSGKTFTIVDYSEGIASDTAARSLASQQLEDMAAGTLPHSSTRCTYSVPNTVTPNVKIMRFLADVGQNSGLNNVQINSLFGQCHSGPGSNHHQGKAVDIGCSGASTTSTAIVQKMDQIGKSYGVSRNDETCSGSKGHWHYSVGGR